MKRLLVGLIVLFMATNGYAASEWSKAQPAGTANVSDLDTLIQTNNESLDRLLSTYRTGCYGYTATSATFSVSIGSVVCSNAAGTLRKFRSNTAVTTVTWAMLDTSTEATSTVYYYYAVADADATTFTVMISGSSTTPTGATYYKKLGSFYNNSDGDIEIGGIIEMYSGFVSALPPGYVLCNGSNGTPDLRNYFIYGAGDNAAVGATKANTHETGTESTITIPTGEIGAASGTVTGAAEIDFMPSYYALAFIQRQGIE